MEDKIAAFVKEKRIKPIEEETIEEKVNKLPWYKKPIEKEDFTIKKAKDKKLYIRHKEWAETIWIGGYDTRKEAKDVVNSYIEVSKSTSLDKKMSDNIHSVYIEDRKAFFG